MITSVDPILMIYFENFGVMFVVFYSVLYPIFMMLFDM